METTIKAILAVLFFIVVLSLVLKVLVFIFSNTMSIAIIVAIVAVFYYWDDIVGSIRRW